MPAITDGQAPENLYIIVTFVEREFFFFFFWWNTDDEVNKIFSGRQPRPGVNFSSVSGTDPVREGYVSPWNGGEIHTLTRLSVWEDIIEFCRGENFQTCKRWWNVGSNFELLFHSVIAWQKFAFMKIFCLHPE
jgi:hypothetical protein